MSFDQLGLGPNTLNSVLSLGYVEATEIQQKAIPVLLEGKFDFIGQAQTGTGKTAAFAIPLIEKLNPKNRNIQALILAPTRELANQVQEEILKLSKNSNLKVLSVYGGAPYDKQIRGLKKDRPQIVVGTPGRVIDMINKKIMDLSNADYLVLDEADEMLNMGFHESVEEILASFNEERRIWMFSATMPGPIKKMIDREFKSPITIKTKRKELSNDDISQTYYVVKNRYRKEALKRIIDISEDVYGIVFCRTKAETKEIADDLLQRGDIVETLHGDMAQEQRDASMARFKAKKVRLLVCTDVAARGIDVDNLSHVFNYGLPQDFESYVHRIGRTGRAGKKGEAVLLIDDRDVSKVKRLEKHIKSQIKLATLPKVNEIKEVLVKKKLNRFDKVSELVKLKGKSFELDDSFEIYKNYFEGFDKEDILKIIFSNTINKELRRLDDIGPLDFISSKKSKGPSEFRSKDGRKRGIKGSRVGNVRFFMNMGKDDGLNIKVLLNDLSEQAGIEKRNIQKVDMKKRFSFLEVPEKYKTKLLKGKNFKIGNKSIHFEVSH